jgi:ATP-dependent exoDNAse (exonuclease V) beta subunit
MSDAARLTDEDARDSIARDLGSTLFVSAGAGSGKTTELVRRVVALVSAGTAIESIAAITFTEKAADELRQRVRLALLEQADGDGDGVVQERCRTALDDLDQAALCTLHAFAQRILTAYPVEAGLPPALSVLDEIASELDFDQRFRAFYSELLGRPELERTVVLALELGITDAQLRTVAEQLDDNWDRVQRPDVPWPEPPALDLRPLVDAGRELLAASLGLGVTDKLAIYLHAWLPGWLEEVEELVAPGVDEIEVLDVLLHTEPPKTGGFGGGGWATTGYGSATAARAAAKGLVDRTIEGSALATTFDPVIEAVLGRIGDELARFTLAEAERRSRSGRLTFHDLLVLCRRLVRHPLHGERVRAELAQRYQALLLDEYQDTDPLQLEIVVAIATPPGADLPVPGQLFFVGDPKQSLYRFRRADIDLFLRTPTLVDADPVSLTTSFRATPALIHWINHVFGRLITHYATDEGILAQPDFEALAAVPAPELVGPPVTVLGEEPHPKKTRIGVLREAEAAEVAATIDRILVEGWEVRPRRGPPRPARRSDIAILIPARTALGQLEAALRASGIAYRLDTGSLVYAADEIRALLMALRVVDDPTDELAAVSVLRTPLYGCSDVDLYRWRVQRGGRWNPRAPRPERLEDDDAVWDAMADLEQRIARRAWLTPSQQLDSLVRDRRVLEAALAGPSPLDAWHRVRFVLEQARAWTEAGGRFLRDYLEWTRRQTGLTGRVAESVLEDGDAVEEGAGGGDDRGSGPGDEAVRILTVHGSKGLEFPITVVCGFNSPPGGRRRGVQVAFGPDGETILRLRQGLEQPGFDATRAIDEQMDEHERIRLLYVACTRARDHLVVSLHRVDDHRLTGAQLLAGCVTGPEDKAELAGVQEIAPTVAVAPPPQPTSPPGPQPEPTVTDLAAWRAQREGLIATARLPGSLSATGLAALALAGAGPDGAGEDDDRFEELAGAPAPDDAEPGLAKRGVDLDLPAWRKGRYGTAIGRAVHAVLQVVDLATGEDIEALAAAQAAAEGIEGEQDRIAALARSALAAPSVVEAAALPHWREVYVGVPFGDTVLEGYIDLLYRRDSGLVVVDHKTDRVAGDLELAGKLAAYRLQLAAYALAVERATGETVVDARLVFCAAVGARDEAVPDLRTAMAEAEALVGMTRRPPDRPAAPDDASAGQARLFDDAGYERLGGEESV